MQALEFFYQTPLKAVKFIDRKARISSPNTLIVGAHGAGKTSLLCNHLAQYKSEERLYINLKDIRISAGDVIRNLGDFLRERASIKALGIDGVSSQDELDSLAECIGSPLESIVIATSQRGLKLKNFEVLELEHLDYEEFILFFKKNLDPDTLFSHFLAHGRAVLSAFLDASEVTINLQNELKKNLNDTQLNIIKGCAPFCGEAVSGSGHPADAAGAGW